MRNLLLWIILCVAAETELRSDDRGDREKMVRTQIENRGIREERILRAMEKVPRHLLVPQDLRRYAYRDRPLPIGHGQTISQPYIVAYMTEKLKIGANAKVLEIGTGSGYQTAVLAEIAGHVYSIEIVPELAHRAQKDLGDLGYKNISVRHSDGFHGWKEAAPFDAIIVTAAAPQIPPPLIAQLKGDGRMIIPVGTSFGLQQLILVTKRKGDIHTRTLIPVRFVPFTRSKN